MAFCLLLTNGERGGDRFRMTGASVAVGRPLRPSDPPELGPYRLLRRIGEGGMGSVYLAERIDDDAMAVSRAAQAGGRDSGGGQEGGGTRGSGRGKFVALKVIRRDLSSDPDFRRRFRSEVARAQQVPAFCTAEVLDADPD